MTRQDVEKWDTIYQTNDHGQHSPAQVLTEHNYLLPQTGTALDTACGIGANAIFLAQHGLETFAWDISEKAIEQLNQSAGNLNLDIHTEVRDVVIKPPVENSFDVIVVNHFLERQLMPHIKNALRKNGLLFYQTFIHDHVDDKGPKNPDYRLAKNELLQLCQDLHIVLYREEGTIGDISKGFRNEAILIGQKF
jgi:SAM-dependent methyltransferase